ncbi:MAG: NnrS family protein [Hyphomicrobiaceae bacterium]|nr:NnrS family protein [Hyphomicrobiaceae bacterium]
MTTSAEQIRAYQGLALFSYGFRPFFVFGAAWSALALALWLPMLSGHLALPSAFSPIDWHVHELIYGYVPSVVAGFLLTAVPNWTGRLPVVGVPLAALFSIWIAGRAAIAMSSIVAPSVAAAVDLSFLAALGTVIAREIVAGRNWRNLKVLAAVGVLLIGNAIFHWEAIEGRANGYGTRIGLAATLMLIMLVGGRIIPSFTRNWLAKRGPGRLPVTFDSADMLVMAASALALLAWIAWPDARMTAWLAILAAVLNAIRLSRWAGERTTAEPLVLILHVAFAFVPIGFVLLALAILAPSLVAPTGALHGWTAGAIGLMTLAVMTRASLGHTAQTLTATWPIQAIYAAAAVSALARIVAAFHLWREPMLHLAATAWVAAFLGFVIVFGPLLLRRRS